MAYDKVKIFNQAKDVIIKHKLFFIEDVIAFLPIGKTAFYEYFPVGADETNELKELLERQRIEVKTAMRSKWYKSENATLQVCLMKLICTDDERKKMAQTFVESKNENTNNNLTTEEIKRINDQLDKSY